MIRNKVKLTALSLVMGLGLYGCATAPGTKDFDPEQAAKTRISLGLTYLQNGNFTQAKFNLDKAVQFAPRLAEAHYGLAYYYQQVGEFALAEDAYQEAMGLDRYNPEIANSYGAFLCEQGKYDKAKAYFLSAIKNETYINTAASYENLALCSYSQGQYQDAVEYLTSALNHQPGRTKSLRLMTEWLLEQGNFQKARTYFKRFERIGRVSAASLWLGARVEHALGDQAAMQGYGDMLVSLYPDHPHTQAFATLKVQPPEQTATETAVPVDQPKVVKVAKAPIPAPALQTEPAAVDAAENAVEEQPIAKADGPQIHIVQQDENLYRISLAYNVLLKRLIEWNGLEDASQIYTGMELFVEDPTSFNQSSN